MILADINLTTESTVAIGGLLFMLSGAIGYIFRLLMQANEALVKLALEKSQTKSFKDMLEDAMLILETRVVASGIVMPKSLAAVVPQANSPPTEEQKATAEVATAQARITAIKLAMGLPAREVIGAPTTAPHAVPNTPIAVAIGQMQQDIAEVPKKTVDLIDEKIKPPTEGDEGKEKVI